MEEVLKGDMSGETRYQECQHVNHVKFQTNVLSQYPALDNIWLEPRCLLTDPVQIAEHNMMW